MRDQKQQKVLEYLKANGSITSLEAIDKFRATRLSSIIFRLRDRYDIATMMVEGKDGGAPYAKYIFKGERI